MTQIRTLSPVSIPYRILQRSGSIAFALIFVLSGQGGALPELPVIGVVDSTFIGTIAVAIVLIFVGYETAYVRRFQYKLTTDSLDIDSGVLSRRNREIPLRRIQNVDISRNIIQRGLNIAVVSFETAGGESTEATLRFVSAEEAKRLQREVGRRKHDNSDTRTSETVDSIERDQTGNKDETSGGSPDRTVNELFVLDDGELALVGFFSIDLRVPGLLVAGLSTLGPILTGLVPAASPLRSLLTVIGGPSVLTGGVNALLGLLPVLIGVVVLSWLVGAASAVTSYYGFRLTETRGELRYERGLFQRYDGSIPFEKIQTLTVEDDPLKRYFGYATLYVETAGYAPGQSGSGGRGSEVAVPLAQRDRIDELIKRIEPVDTIELRRPPKRARRRYLVRAGLIVGAVIIGLYTISTVMSITFPWWVAIGLLPVGGIIAIALWRHRGHWISEDYFVTRNGVFTRETRIVPLYRIQTVIDTRTVFQRRLGLATIIADTAGSRSLGGSDAQAVDISAQRATTLRTELETRLQRAIHARKDRLGSMSTTGVSSSKSSSDTVANNKDTIVTTESDNDGSKSQVTDTDDNSTTHDNDQPADNHNHNDNYGGDDDGTEETRRSENETNDISNPESGSTEESE
jgi:putative membrane protein